MNLEILLSSGDTDTFTGAADTVVEDHYLHILVEIEDEMIPEGMKTLQIRKELEHSPEFLSSYRGTMPIQEFPKPTKTQTYAVAATYAPGMWMKVVYVR